MKKNKWYTISVFIIICVLLNLVGKCIAGYFRIPLWLDSLGTVAATYVCGPVCGVIVGVTLNILYSIIYSWTYACYAIVSVSIAVVAGICISKDYMKTLLGALTSSFYIALVSCSISVIFNYMFFNGYTNNIWGDGVIESLLGIGFNDLLSHVAGQFYIDFPDKIITVLALYIFVRYDKGKNRFDKRIMTACIYIGIAAMAAVQLIEVNTPKCVYAAFDNSRNNQNNIEETPDYNTYLQTVYGRENGIPGGCANDIAQTNDGILWIGTYGGLYRYNGTEFKWVDEYASVKTVNCLYKDEEGRLWIGTNDGGVSIMIDETIINVVSEKEGLSADSVKCITQGSDGDYYIGTTGAMSIVSLADGLTVKSYIDDIKYAVSADSDKNGNIAVVSDNGQLSIVKNAAVISEYSASDGGRYTTCSFDDAGMLYVGTSKGNIDKYEYDLYNNAYVLKESVSCNELNNIKEIYFVDNTLTENGTLFVCADNGTGYYDSQNQFINIDTGSFNNSIDHMTADYQGNLWFTSSRLGLLRLSRSAFTQLNYEHSDEKLVVNTVTMWNGNYYIGTDSGIAVSYAAAGSITADSDYIQKLDSDLKELVNKLVKELDNVRIRCITTDSKNNMWICTTGKGIYEVTYSGEIIRYDENNGLSGNRYRTITELSDNTMLAAGDTGLSYIVDEAVIGNIGYSMKNSKVLCTLETDIQDYGRVILAGTDGNGIEVISDGRVIDNYDKDDGLSSAVILRMVKDASGEGVFIVTSNSLCYMDKTGIIRILDNFPYYNNYNVVNGNNDNLFVLGSAGIYVVDKSALLSGKELDYKLLNGDCGLENALTPNAWDYIDVNNNLYMSTDDGVMIVNLNDYSARIRSYRIQMKSVKVDGESLRVKRGEELYIDSKAQMIEMFPEIINYSVNTPYVSIYLEGYDAEPRIILQSDLTNIIYMNIPVGTYTFHLSVLDENGRVPISENTYTIIKEAKIYDYWWFKVYMVGIFALTVAYLTWIIFHTQIKRTLDFQKKELEFVKKQLEMGNETVLTIARTVDAKDVNTSQHSLRVSEYSVMIAKELGYSDEECENLRKAALLHDIGKIGIPDRILNKPERLTDEEYAIMKSHVEKGAEILKSFTLVNHVEEGALYHHERYDGKGYMHGLKGEEIPLNARIIGIADTFDAMTANRVYRKKLDMDYVLGEIRRGSGTQFDPKLVDIMLRLIDSGRIDIDDLYKDGEADEDK